MPTTSSTRSLLIARDGLELGTLPESEVLELLSVEFLRPTDDYWNPDEAEWKKLEELQRTSKASAGSARFPWLDEAGKTLSAATEMLGQTAGVVARKVQSFMSVKQASVQDIARRVLEDYLPEIRKRVQAQLIDKPAASIRSAIHDDELMRKVFGASYDCLPKPVKRFVTESAFMDFCFQNKAKLFDFAGTPGSAQAPKDPTNEGDKNPS